MAGHLHGGPRKRPVNTSHALTTQTKWTPRRRLLALACSILACVTAVAHAQISVTSATLMERTVMPGDAYAGVITLQNLSGQAQEAKLYQTDYLFAADGSTSFGPAGSVARSNATWIRLLPATVSIPPRGTATATFTVEVPQDSTLAGSFWSMVMVEALHTQQSTSKGPGRVGHFTVRLAPRIRYGVQVATHLVDEGHSRIDFAKPAMKTDSVGGRVLEIDVLNRGDGATRPLVRLELFDSDGALVTRMKEQRRLLYPGTSVRQRFAVGDLPPGLYTAVLMADVGRDESFAVQVQLKL